MEVALLEVDDRSDTESSGREDLIPVAGDDDVARRDRQPQRLAEGHLDEIGLEHEPVGRGKCDITVTSAPRRARWFACSKSTRAPPPAPVRGIR